VIFNLKSFEIGSLNNNTVFFYIYLLSLSDGCSVLDLGAGDVTGDGEGGVGPNDGRELVEDAKEKGAGAFFGAPKEAVAVGAPPNAEVAGVPTSPNTRPVVEGVPNIEVEGVVVLDPNREGAGVPNKEVEGVVVAVPNKEGAGVPTGAPNSEPVAEGVPNIEVEGVVVAAPNTEGAGVLNTEGAVDPNKEAVVVGVAVPNGGRLCGGVAVGNINLAGATVGGVVVGC
jgi:hypothetical protein